MNSSRKFGTVIFDIDGCIALVPPGRRMDFKDAEACSALMMANAPSKGLIHLIQLLYNAGKEIVLMTARPDTFRDCTIGYLVQHNVPYHILYMRTAQEADWHDYDLKKRMYERLKVRGCNVLLAVEDRHSVVDMWRQQGVLCLQPANSD